jgi:hypothetical protein
MGEPRPSPLRRVVVLAIATGLCVSAAIGIVAILASRFDEDWRLLATSFGFSIYCALGSAGAGAWGKGAARAGLWVLGASCAAAAFVLLQLGIWTEDWWNVGLWRAYSIATVLALGVSHANLMLAVTRPSDTQAIKASTGAAIAFGAVDMSLVVLAIAGTIELDGDFERLLGVLLILQVLTSLLPPVLRRAVPRAVPTAGDGASPVVL